MATMGGTGLDTGAVMNLLAGALTFGAVVIQILNARLLRAKNVAEKQRVTLQIIDFISTALFVIGFVLFVILGAEQAGVSLFFLGSVAFSVEYVIAANPATRGQTLQLVLIWCGTIMMGNFYLLGRVLDLIDRLIDVSKR